MIEKHAKYLSLFVLFTAIFVGAENAFPEDVRLTATVDRSAVTLNDRLQLTLTIHGTQDTAPPSFPSIEGFTLLYGPKISAETNIVNGVVSVRKRFTYVLQPTAKGKFTIGPSSVEYQGKVYASQPLGVEVVDAKPSSGAQSPNIDKLVFVELTADKADPYIYEQVVLSFKFYFQRGLPVADIDYTAPAAKNFMEEKLGDQRQYEEIRDGIIYNVLELRTALFPMVSGELTILPARLKCNLVIQQRRDSRDAPFDNAFGDAFFDDFFGRGQRRHPVERSTGQISLKVKPLPEQGRPKDFSGAVGAFNMDASIKTKQVKIGDPITLSMSVYGEGNIQTITEPVLVLNNEKDFKQYPAESSTQITHREEVIRGRKVFSKVIEPQKTDVKATPAVVFSYFDPRAGQYKTITREPVPIAVEAGEQEVPLQLTITGNNAPSVKQQVQLLTRDILPIMTNLSALRNQDSRLHKNPLFLAIISIPAIVVLAAFFIAKQRERLQTDVGYARSRRARAEVKKRLAEAKSELSRGNAGAFYSALSRSVADYLADKCNVSAASATSDTVGNLLKRQGIDNDVIEEISRALADFDYRRFSKDGGTKDEMDHSLKLAEQLIAKLEKHLS